METNTKARIVVGVNGSDESVAALGWAVRTAAAQNRAVEVVHCWKPETFSDVLLAGDRELETASACLVQAAVAVAVSGVPAPPTVISTSVRGDTATTLPRIAADAHLLVLGAHRTFRLRDMVFGQVITRCVKHAACPVTVIDADGKVVNDPALTSTAG